MIDQNRYFSIFLQLASTEDASPMEALVKLQTRKGIDGQTAHANALQCISAVAGREALFTQAADDAMGPMNRLFEKLAQKDPGERLDMLRRIHFGLTVPPAAEAPRTEAEVDGLYRQYMAGNSLTAEALEEEIRQALGQYHISPAAMRLLAHRLKDAEGSTATAMAVGESGRNLKCLMTMELWLENRDTMTLEDAANAACAGADYQSVADAVSKGYLARSAAKVLLVVISVVALFYAVSCFTGVFDSLRMAAEGLAAAEAGAASTAAAEILQHSGRCLVNYGNLYNPTPLDHLGYALGSGFRGLMAIFVGEAVTSKSAADLTGAAACWLSGKLHSAGKGAAAVENLADVLQDETASRKAVPPLRPGTPQTASLSEEEEDLNPAYF